MPEELPLDASWDVTPPETPSRPSGDYIDDEAARLSGAKRRGRCRLSDVADLS